MDNFSHQTNNSSPARANDDLTNLISKYDPDSKPPNIEICEIHEQAKLVRKPLDLEKNTHLNICPCCGCPIEKDVLPLCCPPQDMSFLGSAYPLYFYFLRFSFLFLLIFFLITGIYAFVKNYKGKNCLEKNSETIDFNFCQYNEITKYSYFNNSYANTDNIFTSLNLAATLILMGFIIKFRHFHELTERELDHSLLSPSDFTFMVEKVPLFEKEEDIKKFFEEYSQAYKVNIKKINKAYHIGDYVVLKRKKEEIMKKIEHLSKNEKENKRQLKIFRNQKENLHNEIEIIEKGFENMETKFTGVVFITLDNEQELMDILDFWTDNKVYEFYRKICGCCLGETKKYKGNPIRVKRAPEPNDILWENLGYSYGEILKKNIVTAFFTIVVIMVCAGILFGISIGQDTVTQKKKKSDIPEGIITVLSLISSFLIVFINGMLTISIRKFTSFEKHKTLTHFNISLSKKLGIAQFINTAIINFLVNLILNGNIVWTSGGLIYDAYYILLINAFFPPILSYFNIFYFLKLLKKWQIRIQGQNCNIKQSVANTIYENPTVDLSIKYSNLIKTMLVTAFYAYELPVIVLFGLGNIFLTYWIEKYLLVRRYSKPKTLDEDLSEEMIHYVLEYFLIVFSVGAICFEKIHHDEICIQTWVQFGLSLFFHLIPFQTELIDKCCSSSNQNIYSLESYENYKFEFINDYDRSNPISQNKALNTWLRHFMLLENANNTGENVQKILQKIEEEEQQNKGRFEGIQNYAIFNEGLKNLQSFGNQNLLISSNNERKDKFYPPTKKKTDKLSFINSNEVSDLASLRQKALLYQNQELNIYNRYFKLVDNYKEKVPTNNNQNLINSVFINSYKEKDEKIKVDYQNKEFQAQNVSKISQVYPMNKNEPQKNPIELQNIPHFQGNTINYQQNTLNYQQNQNYQQIPNNHQQNPLNYQQNQIYQEIPNNRQENPIYYPPIYKNNLENINFLQNSMNYPPNLGANTNTYPVIPINNPSNFVNYQNIQQNNNNGRIYNQNYQNFPNQYINRGY